MKKTIVVTSIALGILATAAVTYTNKHISEKPLNKEIHKDFYKPYYQQAEAIVSKMTIDEKIGQMIVPTTTILIPNPEDAKYLATLSDDELVKKFGLDNIKKYHIGSVLVGGNDVPFDANDPSLAMWQKIARLAKTQYSGPESTELLLGTDEVHGNQHVLGSPLFPQNIGLGATHNPDLVKEAARMTAAGTLESGFNWVFAPTVAIAHDYRWGRSFESFSQNPDIVKAMAYNFVDGMQDIQNNHIIGTLATVKHFIGDGRTVNGLDEGNTEVKDFDSLWKVDGAGYRGAIDANIGSLMPSYSSLNSVPMHYGGDRQLLEQISTVGIKGYKFEGFVVSDYAAMTKSQSRFNALNPGNQISFVDSIAKSVNSGVDMIMFGTDSNGSATEYPKEFLGTQANDLPESYKNVKNKTPWPKTMDGGNYTDAIDMLRAIKFAVEQHKISMSRVDQAVTRVIAVKLAMQPSMKLFDNEAVKAATLHAAEESMVLLKNENSTLPIKTKAIKNVVLMGDYDDIGKQNGGWTILWQGFKGNQWWEPNSEAKKLSGAVSVIGGLKNNFSADTNFVTDILSNKNQLNKDDTVAVVVLSEDPYAEFNGDVDNNNPLFASQNDKPQKTFLGLKYTQKQADEIKALKAKGIPVITVIQSGRPMVITDGGDKAPLQNSDALLAAWLPGTSGGQAVANIITGSYKLKSFKTTINGNEYCSNTLAFDWPKDMREVREHTSSLFKEGYGLDN